MQFWLKQCALAFDQFCNAFLGGWADETLSAHAWRLERDGKPFGFMRRVIDTLFWFDIDHCYHSYISEKKRDQCPPELR